MNTVDLSVPQYDEVVEKHNIEILKAPGDLVVRNGDLATTAWGDLMLNNEYYSSYFKFVQEWRFNYPTQRLLFSNVISTTETENIEKQLESALHDIHQAKRANRFAEDIKYDKWHSTSEMQTALFASRNIYAGAIILSLDKFLQALRKNINATYYEWVTSGPQFNGHSIGEAFQASANNLRHNEEWQVTRPPTNRQLTSIKILSDILQEPLNEENGYQHRLSRDISSEILLTVSEGDFDILEQHLFSFTNQLVDNAYQRNLSDEKA
ncbi:hypothetical protein [Thalassospira sp. CH_XMU1448-2]|uniref:hypothetical protein n=1 Tax=Thalassospira sp. CH_XMU1448-2 TaxID=3107773 RepID=UPI0030099DED